MRLALVLSCFFYFVAVVMQMKACNGCIEKERMGLLQIKANFIAQNGDVTKNELVSWVDDRGNNCCSWDRVKCGNVSTGHVTELFLNQLQGQYYSWNLSWTLNFSLFSPFQELVSLDLSGNMFDNRIHNEGFPRLKKLESLDLSSNRLNTSILLSLKGLTSLRTLNLNANWMGGSFPVEGFSSLKKLETLDLSTNQLNASILPSLIRLTSLRTLNLGSNTIEGSFPPQGLQNLKNLKVLDLSENCMVGSIQGLQNLKNLKVLDLSENYMVGSIQGLCKMKDLVKLALSDNTFGGKLPECLHNLTSLHILDLSNNLFNGNFPSFTTNLTSLAYLSVAGNYLQGSYSLSTLANHSKLQFLGISSKSPAIVQIESEKTSWLPKFQLQFLILQSCNLNKDKGSIIPRFLLYQYNLQFIDLSNNKLVGEFPSWLIKNNTRLQVIYLRNNSFAGNFHLFSTSPMLDRLDISNNNISGVLQKDISNLLPDISILNMSMNIFEGNIPTSICEMTGLWFLDLSHNHFSGELPEHLVTNCFNLGVLKLSSNFLHGNISKFAFGSSLIALYLNNNNFSGTLKGILKNNTQLNILDVSNNSISGAIPSSIGKFISMNIFLAAENQLEGEIPIEFSNISSLEMLDLSQNRLFGSIPYFNISSLRFLYLHKNALSGFIPWTLTKSSELVTLDLRDNKLSGDIPYWINKLSKLRVLLLGGNNFQGHIPIQLCQLTSVTIMDLSRNLINGSIPSCFRNLSFGMVSIDYYGLDFNIPSFDFAIRYAEESLANASVHLFLPYSMHLQENEQATVEFRTKHNYYSYKGYILENITGLDLSCNMLTGIIPDLIGNLQQLHVLNLSHNYFSGPIPMSLSNLTQIESLDLSYNNLSDQIPSQLIKLNFLSIFNVSYNNLSGTPPSTGQFATFDEDNYRGNPNLCGPLLMKKCKGLADSPSSQSNTTRRKETTLDMVAFFWSFGAAYVTILLVFIMVLCINVEWRLTWFYYMGMLIRLCFPSFPLY